MRSQITLSFYLVGLALSFSFLGLSFLPPSIWPSAPVGYPHNCTITHFSAKNSTAMSVEFYVIRDDTANGTLCGNHIQRDVVDMNEFGDFATPQSHKCWSDVEQLTSCMTVATITPTLQSLYYGQTLTIMVVISTLSIGCFIGLILNHVCRRQKISKIDPETISQLA